MLILYLFQLENSPNRFIEAYWTTISCLVEGFQHSNPRNLSKKMTKIAVKSQKLEFSANFYIFWVIFRSFWCPWGQLKNPEISTNTYHTKLTSCELDSMGNTFKVEYKFGAWQIL